MGGSANLQITCSALLLLAAMGMIGCASQSADVSTLKPEGARTTADAFMADLVADRVGDALQLMDTDFAQTSGAEAQLRRLFEYCGRPLEFEFKHQEEGFKVFMNGTRKPMRKFYYAGKTTQYPKGECFFGVDVVADSNRMVVTTFGPLKLMQGQLPEWLK
jgi:hypothetical protein